MENPDLPIGVAEMCTNEIIEQIKIILSTPYIFKQFSKILRGFDLLQEFEVENPLSLDIPDRRFMMQQIEKVADMISEPYFCYTCHMGIKDRKGVLYHMLSQHESDIDGQELVDQKNASKERAKEEGRNEVAVHHRDCNSCDCTCLL